MALFARLAGSLSVLQPHTLQKAASVERMRLWRSVEPVSLSMVQQWRCAGLPLIGLLVLHMQLVCASASSACSPWRKAGERAHLVGAQGEAWLSREYSQRSGGVFGGEGHEASSIR